MYAWTYTRLHTNFAVAMLGRYQSNLRINHWEVVIKVLRYLQGTKDHMLTYKRCDHLEVIGYQIQILLGVWILKIHILLFISISWRGDFMEE